MFVALICAFRGLGNGFRYHEQHEKGTKAHEAILFTESEQEPRRPYYEPVRTKKLC